ncbi:MAG: hypothetical protein ABL959_10250 [Pyrinomonadaceae bacterium]
MTISRIILWIFVSLLSIEVGAGLYETLVIIPMWMGGAPESVIRYYELYAANPQFALRAGPRFWMFLTPSVGIFALATLLASFKTSPQHRKWRLIGSGISFFVVAATFAWFVPNIMRLTFDVPTMSPAEIATTASWWVNLNYLRCVLAVIAMLCMFRTISLADE